MQRKILMLDLNQIRSDIAEYKLAHNHSFCDDDHPIVLMNRDTFEYLEKLSEDIIPIKKPVENINLCGCKVAIANWVPFGEIELR